VERGKRGGRKKEGGKGGGKIGGRERKEEGGMRQKESFPLSCI